MDNFAPIDMEKWHRADLFRHYTEEWPGCLMTYQVTVDVTDTVDYTRERNYKTVPAFYYLAAKAFCEQENFRMGYKGEKPGFWDKVTPFYPVMNKYHDITFHNAAWNDDYHSYYRAYLEEAAQNADCTRAVCGQIPENFVLMSVLPFMNFETCSFSLKNAKCYLSPALFMGQYKKSDSCTGRLLMPVSMTCNHAAADGYHAQAFFESFQDKINHPAEWLRI